MKRLAIAAILAGTALLAARELPHWRPGGAMAVGGPPLAPLNLAQIHLSPGAHVLVRGDSNVLASRLPQTAVRDRPRPFGAVLDQAAGGRLRVRIEGAGGDTAAAGLLRIGSQPRSAELVVLLYGDNDSAPRGLLSRRRPVPVARYVVAMRTLIRRHRAAGSRVLVLAPLGGASWAIAARTGPYRVAAREAAGAEGVAFADPQPALAACGARQPPFQYDASHLTAQGHACLGRWLARMLSPPGRSPPARPASPAG